MSEVKVNKISPRSGTTVTLGDSGDTFTIPSGATFNVAGTLVQSGSSGFTGPVTITTTDNSAGLTLKSTDDDAGSGPLLDLVRDSGSPADGDAVGQIKFTADNDAGQSTLFADIITTVNDASDGSEDGSVFFRSLTNGSNSTIEMVGGGFKFADNGKAIFGTGDDLQIFHDGSNSYVSDYGTGFLVVQTNGSGILFQNENGTEGLAKFLKDGAVELNYDNSKKFETTSGGITVTGSVLGNGSVMATGGTDSADRRGIMTHDGSSMIFKASGNSTNRNIIFERSGDGSADESMRIDTSKRVMIGASTGYTFTSQLNVFNTASLRSTDNYNGSPNIYLFSGVDTTGGLFFEFTKADGTRIGSVTRASATSVAYNTTSDYRLKENVVDLDNATARLKQLQPKRFNFIADADTTVDGFLAHEVSDIVPEAITGEKDEIRDFGNIVDSNNNIVTENVNENYPKEEGQTWVKTETRPVYQGIDQAKLVPLLVKTIQELEARITTLEG